MSYKIYIHHTNNAYQTILRVWRNIHFMICAAGGRSIASIVMEIQTLSDDLSITVF